MHEAWCWLSNNSPQLQAVGSIFAVLVAVALGFVALRQARAADAQARAAKIQAEAARAQVEAANRQIETSLIIGDTQTSPNISITNGAGPGGVTFRDSMAILNNGFGTAHELKLRYRDESVNNAITLQYDRLVTDDSVGAQFDLSRGVASGFRLTYRTMFDSEYALEFEWHPTNFVPLNQKVRLVRRGYHVSAIIS
jgi:hypothetical protein